MYQYYFKRKIKTHFVWNKRSHRNLSIQNKQPYIISSFYKNIYEKNKQKYTPKQKSIF